MTRVSKVPALKMRPPDRDVSAVAGAADAPLHLPHDGTETRATGLQPSSEPASTRESDIAAVFGCKTLNAAVPILRQAAALEQTLIKRPTAEPFREAMATLLAMMGELQPRTAVETMLVTQMIGTHRLAMDFMERAVLQGQTLDGTDSNVRRAVSLMRLFTDQLEALARLQGKSARQHVVVEHVTVAAGGQAIVGTVVPRDDRRPNAT